LCPRANVPDSLVSTSTYFFGPHPTGFVVNDGQTSGQILVKAVRDHVVKLLDGGNIPPHSLFNSICDVEFEEDERGMGIARTLTGAAGGFTAATRGSFLSVMRKWMQEKYLWKLSDALKFEVNRSDGKVVDHALARKVLYDDLIAGMKERPAPNLLHRIAMNKARIGAVDVEPGDRIVVSLQSAANDTAGMAAASGGGCPAHTGILFGGHYHDPENPGDVNPDKTVHACPGQRMATGFLLGVIAALLMEPVLEPDGLYSLSVKRTGTV
jgi:hypothetical protein